MRTDCPHKYAGRRYLYNCTVVCENCYMKVFRKFKKGGVRK